MMNEVEVESWKEMFDTVEPSLRWTIVAFKHPELQKSVLYRTDLPIRDLLKAVYEAYKRDANLMSIRGVQVKK